MTGPCLKRNPHRSVPSAVGHASGKILLQLCWSLAVLEQTGPESFWIPWRALSHKQPEEIGSSIPAATSYCQVWLPDMTNRSSYPAYAAVQSQMAEPLLKGC